jgi:hypothetical protein
VNDAMLQLSVADGAVQVTLAPHFPASFDFEMGPGNPAMTGAIASSTVTVALQVALFPALSVTVSTTELAPRFEHVNVLGATDRLAIPQLSVLPPSTCAAVTEAWPAASTYTVALRQTATGGCTSLTVTVNEHVAVLPDVSSAVYVTVVTPTGNAVPDG